MNAAIKSVLYIAGAMFLAHAAQSAISAPSFERYYEATASEEVNAMPKLLSSQDKEYKTRILEASKQPINFAGHYVLSSFGCGGGCVMSFVLDKTSGQVSWLPFTVCCWEDFDPDVEPVAFRKNSRLLVITGSRNELGKGVYYYEFKQGQFVLIETTER
jgi:hypothetical protein